MKLLSLHIDGFGKFKNKDLQFADNMNIVYGYNEAGKSTIFMFIEAMFYGLERASGFPAIHSLIFSFNILCFFSYPISVSFKISFTSIFDS